MQLKNMIGALYSSRQTGSKSFMKQETSFGWSVIEDLYVREICRIKKGNPVRVPGLKKSYIVRDVWTKLKVSPSKIMQVFLLQL